VESWRESAKFAFGLRPLAATSRTSRGGKEASLDLSGDEVDNDNII